MRPVWCSSGPPRPGLRAATSLHSPRSASSPAHPARLLLLGPDGQLTCDKYWRRPPNVTRLVFKAIPDESTRLAALKRGEIDIVYSIRGELAEELQRTPGLTLKPAIVQGPFCLYFADQSDPKSPWHDRRSGHASASQASA